MSRSAVKSIILFLHVLCTNLPVRAQVYNPVTHLSGVQNIHGVNIAVTPSATGAGTHMSCGESPYWIGGPSPGTNPGSYAFSFSTPVQNLRLRFTAINEGEIISFTLNGLPYTLTTANLSAYYGSCAQGQAVIAGGNLVVPSGTPLPAAGGEITISGNISTIQAHANGVANGSIFSIAFEGAYDTVCHGDTLKLSGTAVAGATYSWTGPAGYTSGLQNPSIPDVQNAHAGLYTLTVTSPSGSFTTATHVAILPLPVTKIVYQDPLCRGTELALSDTATNPAITYSWQGPSGFSSTLKAPVIPNIQTAHSGVYSLTTTLDGRCSYQTQEEMNVLLPSYYNFSKVVCAHEGYKFNGRLLTETGTYYDTTVAANGCDSIIMLDLVVLPAPEVHITASHDTVCINGSVSLTATGAMRYAWYGDNEQIAETEATVLVTADSTDKVIKLVATAENTCTDTFYKTVYVKSFQITLKASSTLVDAGNSIMLETTGSELYTVAAWYPSGLFNDQAAYRQQIRMDTSGHFIVVGKSVHDCIDTAAIAIEVIPAVFMPTAFTPNADSRNDYFHAPADNNTITIHAFRVYDRWGKLVWQASGHIAARGWDGTCNGQAVQAGVYFYVIDIEKLTGTRVVHKGDITLIR